MTHEWTLQPPLPVLDGFLPESPYLSGHWDFETTRKRSERILFPHQETGAKYLLDHWGGALFMGPRTGKSLTLVEAIIKGGIFPHLIVCPVSVLATWMTEFLSEGLQPHEIQVISPGDRRSQLVRPGPLVHLINFENVKATQALRLRDILPPGLDIPHWAGVSIDESFRISNPESSVVQEILRSRRPPGQFRSILSGEPAPESGLNLAPQFLFAYGEFFGQVSMVSYLRKFWRVEKRSHKWVPIHRAHLHSIKDLSQEKAFCVKMADLQMGVQKVQMCWDVEPNPEQKKQLRWAKLATKYMGKDPKTGKEKRMEMTSLVRSTFISKISAGLHPLTGEVISMAKPQLILDWLKDHPDESALILSRFTAPIRATEDLLLEAGVSCGSITGKTKKEDRERLRVKFQEGSVRVILAQVKTVKMGMDFSRTNYIFYLSNSESQDDRAQSEERGNHTKKEGILQLVDLCMVGGHDRKLVSLLSTKSKHSQSYIRETLSKWAQIL